MSAVTLNDFKAVLGRVNDGNVVFRDGGSGIEKANHGNALTRAVRKYRTAQNDAEENRRVRAALVEAIRKSPEGKALDQRKLESLIGNLAGDGRLSRKELKHVLEALETAQFHEGEFRSDGKTKLVSFAIDRTKDAFFTEENGGGGQPTFTNRLVARQFRQLRERGVDPRAVRILAVKASDYLKGCDWLKTAETLCRALPREPEFFAQPNLAKFVRNNFALVQAKFVERLLWRGLEVLDNMPEGQPTASLSFAPGNLLMEALQDLMTSYGAKREPRFLSETLLKGAATEVAPPADQRLVEGYDAFAAKLESQLNGLFPDRRPIGFADRQVRNFRAHVEAALRQTFVNALAAATGSPQDRLDAAHAAVNSCAHLLSRLDGDQLKALMSGEKSREILREILDKPLSCLKHEDGSPGTGDVLAVFSEVLNALEARCDLRPLAQAYVKGLALAPDDEARAVADLEKALDRSDAAVREIVDPLRRQRLQTGAADVAGLAASVCKQNEAFRAFARDVTGKYVSQDVLAKRRRSICEDLGGRLSERVKDCLPAQEDLRAWVQQAESFRNLAPEARSAVLQQVDRLYAEPALRGMVLLLANATFLFEGRQPDVSGIARGGGMLTFDVNTIVQTLADIETLTDTLSPKELETAALYVEMGLETLDDRLETSGKQPPHYLYGVLQKTSVDLAKMHPAMRRFVMKSVYMHAMKTVDQTKSVRYDANDFPPGTFGSWFDGADFLADNFLKSDGFGTDDPVVLVKLFASAGVTPADLERGDETTAMRLIKLSFFAHEAKGKLEGLVAWSERVMGKSFDDMTLKACSDVHNLPHADPLLKLDGNKAKAAKFLSGQMSRTEANLSPAERRDFLAALHALEAGETATVRIFGESVAFSRGGDGMVRAKLQGDPPLPLHVPQTAELLIRQLENQMADEVSVATVADVRKILPPAPEDGDLVARPRELYARVLSGVLGVPAVQFAEIRTAELAKLAGRALDALGNEVEIENLRRACFAKDPETYNDAETVELRNKFVRSSPADRTALVKLTYRQQDARGPAPHPVLATEGTFRDLVADLFMNKDTWSFDANGSKPGLRLLLVLREYKSVLRADGGLEPYVANLPAFLQPGVRDFLAAVKDLDLDAPGADDELCRRLDALERDCIDRTLDAAMRNLQDKAAVLFAVRQDADKPLWQKTLKDINGTGGLDENTPNGKFMKTVLARYFTQSDAIEKRSMLAAMIRNVGADSGDGTLVAEALKGAGPLLQKMLQGLPPASFGPEMQQALKDMKSRLLPIPDAVIEAQMLELVRSSKGAILSVDVLRSIGQATVGQALLCRIYTKDHPVDGEEVVIKLLRPNVQTAVRRERKLFASVAQELDRTIGPEVRTQQESFEGRYASILEELDFTREAENVDLGVQAYDRPLVQRDGGNPFTFNDVRSMRRFGSVPPMRNVLVLEKVDGFSADRVGDNVRQRLQAAFGPYMKTVQLQEPPPKTVFEMPDGKTLLEAHLAIARERKQLVAQRQQLTRLIEVWTARAFFGDGVFHNDLHPGNLMVTDKGLTMIDFGNVMRLKPVEQQALVYLSTAALTGDATKFVEALMRGLPADQADALKKLPDGVRADLDEVLHKGSSDDVLSRLLAGLSVVQGHGLPVPNAVYNFMQSVVRLQGVAETFEAAIDDLDALSQNVFYGRDFAEKLRSDETLHAMPLLAKLDQQLILLGKRSDSPFSSKEIRDKGRVFAAELAKIEAPKTMLDPAFLDLLPDVRPPEDGDNPDREDEREDPFLQENAVTFGAEVMEFQQQAYALFARPDDAEAFFEAFCRKYRDIGVFDGSVNQGYAVKPSAYLERLNAFLDRYKTLRRAESQDARHRQELNRLQNDIVRTALEVVYDLGRQEKFSDAVFPEPSQFDFLSEMGKVLKERKDMLARKIAEAVQIKNMAAFEEILGLINNGGGGLKLMGKIAKSGDAQKYAEINSMKNAMNDAQERDGKHADAADAAAGHARKTNGELGDRKLKPEFLEAVVKAAQDVAVPWKWKPSLAKPEDRNRFRAVLENALDALKGLRLTYFPDEPDPSDADLRIFAILLDGTFEAVGLASFIRNPKNAKALDELVGTGTDPLARMVRLWKTQPVPDA